MEILLKAGNMRGGEREGERGANSTHTICSTPKEEKQSEVDSAKRLWDAGTDTPRVIEPRKQNLKDEMRTIVSYTNYSTE